MCEPTKRFRSASRFQIDAFLTAGYSITNYPVLGSFIYFSLPGYEDVEVGNTDAPKEGPLKLSSMRQNISSQIGIDFSSL